MSKFQQNTKKSRLNISNALSILSCISLPILINAQDNWSAIYEDIGDDDYKLTMSWVHNPTLSLVIDSGVKNPGSESNGAAGVCSTTDSSAPKAPTDGLPYWVPRFYPKPVSEEITKKTGIHFASVDWQPCGHKDVLICHAESHYDFHLYYLPLETMQKYKCANPSPTCKVTDFQQSNGQLTKSYQSTQLSTDANSLFFRMMKGNKPISYKVGGDDGSTTTDLDFCVDQSSAMPESGIHYGDVDDTTREWKAPVTIMGSHDCQLTFFEPMVSWKWVRGGISNGGVSWPKWESGEITYDEKNFHPLPTSWSVEVDEKCKTVPGGKDCNVKIIVNGKRCKGPNGCGDPPRSCGTAKDCISKKQVGIVPVKPATEDTTTVAAASSTTQPPTTTSAPSTTATTTAPPTTSTAPSQSTETTSTTSSDGSEITTFESVSDYEVYTFTQALTNKSEFAAIVDGRLKLSMIMNTVYPSKDLYLAFGRPLQIALAKYLGIENTGSQIAIKSLDYYYAPTTAAARRMTEDKENPTIINMMARKLESTQEIEFTYEIGLSKAATQPPYIKTEDILTNSLNFEKHATFGTMFRAKLVTEVQRAQVAAKGNSVPEQVLRGSNVGQVIDGHEITHDSLAAAQSNDANTAPAAASSAGAPAASSAEQCIRSTFHIIVALIIGTSLVFLI